MFQKLLMFLSLFSRQTKETTIDWHIFFIPKMATGTTNSRRQNRGINSVSDALNLIDSLRSVISDQDNDQVNK